MKVRSIVLGTAAALLLTLLPTAPAQAAVPSAPSIDTLSLSTPGHVTGKVSSTAPYVVVTFADSYFDHQGKLILPVTGGSATFDMETWGFQAPVRVITAACPTVETAQGSAPDCSEWVASAPFAPVDVRPTISFSDDVQVGPLDTITITASDTGGGRLSAAWGYQPPFYAYIDLDKHGATTITEPQLMDGAGFVRIRRCAAARDFCTEFAPPIAKSYDVRRTMDVTTGYVQTLTADVPVQSMPIRPNRGGTFELSYDLVTGGTQEVVAGTHRTMSGTTQPGTDILAPVDGSAVPDGTYTLVGTVRVHDPAFGSYEAPFSSSVVQVQRTRPVVTSATTERPTIYPRVTTDRYPGSTRVTLTSAVDPQTVTPRVQNSAGTLVGTAQEVSYKPNSLTYSWHGRDANNAVVPPGTYTIVLVDEWGNRSAVGARIQVSGLRYIAKEWHRTVSASGSLDEKFVGRCSTLRKPSLRKWKGSLGFYANTKCGTQTWKASGVSTLHYTRLPALNTTSVRVTVKGGAAKRKPRSRGVIRYLSNDDGWIYEKTTGSKVGSHHGNWSPSEYVVLDGNYLAWGFYTGWGDRYDVKSFEVTVRYYVVG